jgi:glucose dehydrogenase
VVAARHCHANETLPHHGEDERDVLEVEGRLGEHGLTGEQRLVQLLRDGDGPTVDYINRATPIYANGRLFAVAGRRRTAVAIDPATGETLWTFREPQTRRWERSSRQNYGKWVAYAEIDGRGVIYMVTPAFFLHALDAETGRPLEGFGRPVPLPGFADHGTVDMLADLGHPFDPDYGIPEAVGYITNTSPPIVVNGVVIVGNSNLTGRLDPRRENVPGDILAYDARTGEHRWTFRVIPRPGEVGHDTWENDAWEWSGNINIWPPMSADLERGIVYVTTDAPTNDYFGGHRPGDNLFANSVVAIDVRSGERLWHFQAIHHDIWDRDFPHPPQLLDLTVDGRRVPALVQSSKQAFIYALDRVTGEPIWPIVERPVPQSRVPTRVRRPRSPTRRARRPTRCTASPTRTWSTSRPRSAAWRWSAWPAGSMARRSSSRRSTGATPRERSGRSSAHRRVGGRTSRAGPWPTPRRASSTPRP